MIKKDLKGSFLVLWDEKNPPAIGYQQEMIKRNKISGLLKCDVLPSSTGTNLKYDISSMQSLSSMYAGKQINGEDALKIIESVCQVIQGVREFILEEEGIIFDPDYIFFNYKDKSIGYCYYPGISGNVFSSIHVLAEFLLNRMDHTDKAGLKPVYMFYELTNRETYSVGDIQELLINEKKKELSRVIEQEQVRVMAIEDNQVKEAVNDESSGSRIRDKAKIIKKQTANKKIKLMDILIWLGSIAVVGWIIYDNFLKKYLRKVNILYVVIGLVIAVALVLLIIIRNKNKKKTPKSNESSGQLT